MRAFGTLLSLATVAMLIVSCSAQEKKATDKDKPAYAEGGMGSPREVVLAWVEALNRRDAVAVAALCHEDVENLQLPVGEPGVGRHAMLEHFPRLFRAFPDCHTRVVAMFEDGEWAVLEWELSGTWRGEFAGHPPNGRAFTVRGCELFQVVGGQIVTQRGYWDKATWFGQLGIPLG